MQHFDYREAFRRRWPLLVVLAIVGGVVAVLIPVSSKPKVPVTFLTPRYTTTATVAVSSSNSSAGSPVTSGPDVLSADHNPSVESAAAAKVGHGTTAEEVGAAVVLTPTGGVSAQLVGTADTPSDAATLTNDYAAALLAYLGKLNASRQQQAVSSAQSQMNGLQNQLNSVNAQLATAISKTTAPGTNPQVADLEAQRNALQSAYQTAFQNYTQLAAQPQPGPGLVLAVPASATTANRLLVHKVSILDERRVRGPIGAAAGLLIGLLLLLLLEQLDPRIKGRADAEDAFGLPVLAEIPRYRFTQTMRDVVVDAAPLSRAAESYRTLRTVLLADPRGRGAPPSVPFTNGLPPELPLATEANGMDNGRDTDATMEVPSYRARKVAPVAGGRGGGRAVALACVESQPSRSVAVANLATSFAEYGYSVLVLAGESDSAQPMRADFDRDSDPNGRGSWDVISRLDGLIRQTKIPGVERAVIPDLFGGAAGALSSIVNQARQVADVVIVDPAPVLSAHDAAAIADLVDQMVLVAQCRWTTRAQGRLAAETLSRVDAPLRGVLLTQVPASRSRRLSGRSSRASWTVAPESSRSGAVTSAPTAVRS